MWRCTRNYERMFNPSNFVNLFPKVSFWFLLIKWMVTLHSYNHALNRYKITHISQLPQMTEFTSLKKNFFLMPGRSLVTFCYKRNYVNVCYSKRSGKWPCEKWGSYISPLIYLTVKYIKRRHLKFSTLIPFIVRGSLRNCHLL